MPTPIISQGSLPTDPDASIIYTTPAGRQANIRKITITNEDLDFEISVYRVINRPDPVYTEPQYSLLYFKQLNAGDTLVDDLGYELIAGDSVAAFSNVASTSYVIDGNTEQV